MVCGFPCYKAVGSVMFQNTDWALADLLPLFLAILFIFTLISHVPYQRHKISRRLVRNRTHENVHAKVFTASTDRIDIFNI
jgi:hypothetical protein